MSDYIFSDRPDAGRQLAQRLLHLLSRNPVILALPRGGVPVAFEVAEALKAPLDLLFVRKIGAPGHPELGLGAVVDGAHPQVVLNEDVVSQLEIPATYIEREARNQLREIERRRERYLGGRPPINVTNRTAIVVDDGIATGGTIKAALGGLQRVRPAHLVLAVPVAPAETINQLRSQADEIVCLATPYPFHAVGAHYLNFNQTSARSANCGHHHARRGGGPGNGLARQAGGSSKVTGEIGMAGAEGGGTVLPPGNERRMEKRALRNWARRDYESLRVWQANKKFGTLFR